MKKLLYVITLSILFSAICLAQEVIVSKSTFLKDDPSAKAKNSFPVAKGLKIQLVWHRPVRGWYLVKADNSSYKNIDDYIQKQAFGWIRASAIIKIK